MSIYLELTTEFNRGRTRAILCSGQAVVLLRLAIASKDGDWILREDQEALNHVIATLEARGARYRFGAPLDLRWLRHGWSSHLEFAEGGVRVRTDFFTRPPRVSATELEELWREQEGRDPAFTGPRVLLRIKQTAREKDWPFVGELARLLMDPRETFLHARNARDLIALASAQPELAREMTPRRPALAALSEGLDGLRMALERERFEAMDEDAARLSLYVAASAPFGTVWRTLEQAIRGLPLGQAHRLVLDYAERWLPVDPTSAPPIEPTARP
jgi:hypothetical protein